MKKRWLIPTIIIAVVLISGLFQIKNKLTYLEYQQIGGAESDKLDIYQSGDSIQQTYAMPYNLFYGISIKIGTSGVDGNSEWLIRVFNQSNNEELYSWNVIDREFADNEYHFFSVDDPISVNIGDTYLIDISPESINKNDKMIFYISDQKSNGLLRYNGDEIDGSLLARVYGGSTNFFWVGIYLFISAYLLILYFYCLHLYKNGKSVFRDELVQAMCMGIICFLMLAVFANNPNVFTDETDNMRGGMILANGGVLYRDYYTQHTPLVYYLCKLFAHLGAASAEQFRLLFYLLMSLIWAGLYYRHQKFFGRRKMFAYPILCILIVTVQSIHGSMILSEAVQGLCLSIVLLEFIRYLDDKEIDIKRSIIISLAVSCSILSAFISVYAISIIVVGFIISEIIYVRKCKYSIRQTAKRYRKFLVIMMLPFIGVIAYFAYHGALGKAYEMAFSFNTNVYPLYTGGFGSDIIQPYFGGVSNILSGFTESIKQLFYIEVTDLLIINLAVYIMLCAVFVKLFFRGNKALSLLFFIFVCCCATRGMDFHNLPFWYVSVLVIVLFMDLPEMKLGKSQAIPVVLCIWLIFIVRPFISNMGSSISREPHAVSETEYAIVSLSSDNEPIFIDAYRVDSMYLLYKGIYPVNRANYILPWYMDWYEDDTVEDLIESSPKIAVFNPDTEVRVYSHFCRALEYEITNRYTRLSDDSLIWILND